MSYGRLNSVTYFLSAHFIFVPGIYIKKIYKYKNKQVLIKSGREMFLFRI